MFNFEDEIVVGFSERIPWLLLVNLLVMFLLILVLCYSTIFSLDIVAPHTEDEDQKLKSRNRDFMVINDCRGSSHHLSKASQDKEIVNENERTSISNRRRNRQREIVEEIQGEGKFSRREDVTPDTMETLSYSSYSPCHWLELASKAFLSCFGLLECQDSTRNKRGIDNNDDYSSSSSGSRPHQL